MIIHIHTTLYYSIISHLFKFVLVEFKIPNNGFANRPIDPVTDPSMKPFKPDVFSPANGSKKNPRNPVNFCQNIVLRS